MTTRNAYLQAFNPSPRFGGNGTAWQGRPIFGAGIPNYDNRYSWGRNPLFGADCAPCAASVPQYSGPSCPSPTEGMAAAGVVPNLGPWGMQQLFPNAQASLVRESARGKFLMYGFDSATTIAAAATATLSTAPQKRHIPTRLTISQNLMDSFALSDIRIGVEPVLATVGNLSMAVFAQNATAPDFRAVLAEVGNDISLVVTNITAATPTRFIATMYGVEFPPLVH